MANASVSRSVVTDVVIDALLHQNAPVACGISGGKDSVAMAIAVARELQRQGHSGPKILIHADLGRVEWEDSIAVCHRLAQHLGWELIVVRRARGDMLDRWEQRWVSRSAAYINLETVKLTLPFATPIMRFCTGEMKVDPISRALRKRFPSGPIVSVDGVRAQESSARSKKTVSSPSAKLSRKGHAGINWHAILPWTVEEVFEEMAEAGFAPHVAYTEHGSSRVSCNFCILASLSDLQIAANLDEHLETYLSLVDLECRSTFGFQGGRWLADVAPHRQPLELRARVAQSQAAAQRRRAAEAQIPVDLLFDKKGWPSFVPSLEQATLLAEVRRCVGEAVNLPMRFTDPASIQDRYEDLLNQRLAKAA